MTLVKTDEFDILIPFIKDMSYNSSEGLTVVFKFNSIDSPHVDQQKALTYFKRVDVEHKTSSRGGCTTTITGLIKDEEVAQYIFDKADI